MPGRKWAATSLSEQEKWFIRATDIGDGIIENEYTMSVAPLRNTKMQHGTDPYGKSALLTIHQGGIQAMGEDLKEHLDIAVSANLNIDLYNRYRQGVPEVKQETEKPAVKKTIQPEQEVKQEEKQQVQPGGTAARPIGIEEETDRKEPQTYRSLQTAQFVRPTAGDKYQSNHPYK